MMKILDYKKFEPSDVSMKDAENLFAKVWGTEPADSTERFVRHQSYTRFFAIGAYDQEDLVGLVYGYASHPGQYHHDKLVEALQENPDWLNETMELVGLVVNPHFRGQGIGKQLVANWLNPLHGRILLTSKDDNTVAHQLFNQFGFEILKKDFQMDGSNGYIYGKVIPWVLPVLETERLLLRPWREEDADDLYAYAQDNRVGPMAGWSPHQSVEESREVIGYFQSEGDTYAIEWKETGTIIGGIGLHDRRPDEKLRHLPQREIGYVLSPDYWGKGIMPEAVHAVVVHGFEEMNLDMIWCGHFGFNDNSRRVVEKTGFRYVRTKPQVLTRLDNLEVQNLIYIQTRENYFSRKESLWKTKTI